jgi:hypothetical protein
MQYRNHEGEVPMVTRILSSKSAALNLATVQTSPSLLWHRVPNVPDGHVSLDPMMVALRATHLSIVAYG